MLAHYALGPETSFFTMESLSEWLFSHSTASHLKKIAKLASLNNISESAALSSESVLYIGTIKNICESVACDRRLTSLATKFDTSVRQLLENNHRCIRFTHRIVLEVCFTQLLFLRLADVTWQHPDAQMAAFAQRASSGNYVVFGSEFLIIIIIQDIGRLI
jgi:hypothetical protein